MIFVDVHNSLVSLHLLFNNKVSTLELISFEYMVIWELEVARKQLRLYSCQFQEEPRGSHQGAPWSFLCRFPSGAVGDGYLNF